MNETLSILLVDPCIDLCETIQERLQADLNCNVKVVRSLQEALVLAADPDLDIVISALRFPDGHGIELFEVISANDFSADFILFSGASDLSTYADRMITVKKPAYRELLSAIYFLRSTRV